MIKILVVSPYSKDANSLYRGLGPWQYLTKANRDEVSMTVGQDDIGMSGISWDVIGQFDLLFLHRPCRDDDLTLIKVARNMNVPVWIDYDDLLTDVPYWNPTAGQYSNPAMHQVMATCLATADVVSVSTSALYDKFKPINKNVVIIPNMYRSDLFPYREKTLTPRKNAFVWRGTATHDADLMSVLGGLKTLPDKITFWGGPYWGVLKEMPPRSCAIMGPQDPFLYLKSLYDFAPKVMLFPLVDCLFNRCKSNIAYQEALHAGAVCVAPDMPEWNRPGVITYEPGNSMSFLEAATTAYKMSPEAHTDAVLMSYQHMLELYDAPVVNKIRQDVLHAVLAPEFERNTRNPWDQMVGMWAQGILKGSPTVPGGIPEETLKAKGLVG